MKVREKKCKTILSKSRIYDVDYSINPYTGCEHGCEYCYATFMKKYTNSPEPWGDFVEVKVNARQVLDRDLMKKEKGSILLSSVTDPYQPVERDYRITRDILKRLSNTEFPVNILTKSDIILEDIGVLKDFNRGRISVGFTVNFLNERDREIWEPGAPQISKRIEALKEVSESGINSYVHIGPYLEGITNIEAIVSEVNSWVSELQIEDINLRGRKSKIMKVVGDNYSYLEPKYEQILRNIQPYKNRLKSKVEEINKKTSLPIFLFME